MCIRIRAWVFTGNLTDVSFPEVHPPYHGMKRRFTSKWAYLSTWHISLSLHKSWESLGAVAEWVKGLETPWVCPPVPHQNSAAGFNISVNSSKTKPSRQTWSFNRCSKAPFTHCNWAALSLDFSWHFVGFDPSSGYFAILWGMFAAPFESLCYLSPSQITSRSLQVSVDAFPRRIH